jgi:hypothetical protein
MGYSLALATSMLLGDPTDERLITSAIGDIFLLKRLGQETVIKDATKPLIQNQPGPPTNSKRG